MTAEHRVLGARLRRYPDPETSDDPRVVSVLDQLRAVELAPLPRAEFRAELRAQLVAITPRIVAESAAHGTAVERSAVAGVVALAERPRPTPRPRPAVVERPAVAATVTEPGDSFWTKLRGIPIGRPLAVAASIVTVLALVLGGAVWMSQNAVPGDTLYGLKRASERFELARADNDTERAQLLLQFATTRVDEANELLSKPSASAAGSGPLADGRLSSVTAGQIADTLSSADDNTRTASRLLGGVAVQKASGAGLTGMATWAPEQIARLGELRRSLPAGTSLRSSASKSAGLVQAVAVRASSLRKQVACKCLGAAPTDDLGPVPATVPVTPVTPAPKRGTKSSAPKTSTPTTPNTSGTSGSGSGRSTSTAPKPKSSTTRAPVIPLPSLPLPAPPTKSRTPIIDLCKVSLLGIKICPSKTP